MNIERTILEILDLTHGYALPESTLAADVNLRAAGGVTLSDVRAALARLESRRQVASAPDEDRGTVWRITSGGTARLRG